MDYSDSLLTIAELAIALAGFASLISVLGRRQDDTSRVAAVRLRSMLEVSFRNAAFALLPLPFLQAVPSDPILWRILSGLYLVVALAHIALRWSAADAPGGSSVTTPMLVLLGITALASIANVVGLGGPHAFSLYLANLLLGLSAAGLSFLSVAASVFGIQRT